MKRIKFLTAEFELNLIKNSNYQRVIGIDEVGRGCWAGPTAVGFYEITNGHRHVDKVIDSKKLSKKNRDLVYETLNQVQEDGSIPLALLGEGRGEGNALSNTVLFGEIESINEFGIGKTITNLISNFIEANDDGETYFLIDGQFAKDFGPNSKKIVKGDLNYYSIAAASILAKVSRDRFMEKISLEYPSYGFERHKGYPTKEHINALNNFGITDLHRKSFKPIKSICERS